MYEGAEIKQSEIFKYLGLWLHHRDWFAMAGQNMAEAAEKAMWAMLRLCRTNDIQLLETKNRLFTIHVASVGNYGCQVWGADYLKFSSFDHIMNNPMQRLQLSFLRHISGCSKSVHRFNLLKEFGAVPFQVQYARLCARYWNKARVDKGIAGHHLRANVLLFLRGSQLCWVAKFLECMTSLGSGLSLHGVRSLDVDTILALGFNEGWVKDTLLEKYETLFECEGDPRTAPSRHAHRVKYNNWFYQDRKGKMHKHLATAIPTLIHKGLMRFRLSCTDLRIHDHTIDRPQRICTVCGANRSWPHGRLEDELHLVFECPVYDEIRKWYPALFKPSCVNMNDFMNQSDQYAVAFFISACMSRRRNVMLGILPPVVHRVTRGLDTFSSDDSESDNDNDRDDPSNHPILWGPDDEVYHDNALVYTMPGPPEVQMNRFFD
jgi:hypothetical protein